MTVTKLDYHETSATVPAKQDGIWVFGYGSLIWKPPIHYESNEDHRGTPEKPGRVVTLIPYDEWVKIEDVHDNDGVTWGVAFKIPSDDVETTRAYLDHREKVGSLILKINNRIGFYSRTTSNEAYVGPAPAEAIAKQIFETYGPSGWNAEYLLNLAKALREISPNAYDSHVFELEKLVKELIDQDTKQ
ncbi:hypothetical protein EC973_004195 [Apophysomyces ossiformis]|uniref:glutathione-specific gamma-glutamylcyclotransferase n=1 Tax=Apophysomyces ossiformis TaxID=679940 RepID=A0A8H7ETA5_9FUNG|nr:hypothetical protein EC973_004195 [Apophysomyces ossiformis]